MIPSWLRLRFCFCFCQPPSRLCLFVLLFLRWRDRRCRRRCCCRRRTWDLRRQIGNTPSADEAAFRRGRYGMGCQIVNQGQPRDLHALRHHLVVALLFPRRAVFICSRRKQNRRLQRRGMSCRCLRFGCLCLPRIARRVRPLGGRVLPYSSLRWHGADEAVKLCEYPARPHQSVVEFVAKGCPCGMPEMPFWRLVESFIANSAPLDICGLLAIKSPTKWLAQTGVVIDK